MRVLTRGWRFGRGWHGAGVRAEGWVAVRGRVRVAGQPDRHRSFGFAAIGAALHVEPDQGCRDDH